MQVMANGRVRRTEEEWRTLLGRWKKSGVGPREFCRKESVQLSSFLRWQQRLQGSPAQSDFAPVVSIPPLETRTSSWMLGVTLPNGVTLELRG
ncbi:MAG: hypothetical protein FJY88_13670 [Candidatus Eisenbacteria bacterium]|nr:hypothetical protein [Candidatus Eisenbacteria bacterium]